jgi:hypothetical protein
MDRDAVRNQFGRQALDEGARHLVESEIFGKADTAKGKSSRMLNGARDGTDPILGHAGEKSPAQTGIRNDVPAYKRPVRRGDSGW